MNSAGKAIAQIITAIIGLAVLAVLLSNRAKTGEVIQGLANGFATILSTVVSPITAPAPPPQQGAVKAGGSGNGLAGAIGSVQKAGGVLKSITGLIGL